MPLPAHSADDLDEVRELNRLFLRFLRSRARSGDDCLGLSPSAVGLLEAAEPARLETLATFPRALFQLNVGQAAPLRVMDPAADAAERSLHALQLTLLHSAWNMSRRSPYAARLFLGLDEHDVRVLRATALSDLPKISYSGTLVSCGFLDAAWLWQQLLTETRPESRRQLLLIGLQPRVQCAGTPPMLQSQQASA